MTTEIADRLKMARVQAGFSSARHAANSFGWNPVTYTSHENGTRGLRSDIAKRYAAAFRVSPAWLLTGEGDPGQKPLVPVVGHVGAGQEINLVDDHAKGAALDYVEAPPESSPSMVAVSVRGDSMYPVYFEDDLLYYDRHVEPETLIGRRCVVKTQDGRILIKTLRRGSAPGLYTLESTNAAPIEDIALEWVAPIAWTKPK